MTNVDKTTAPVEAGLGTLELELLADRGAILITVETRNQSLQILEAAQVAANAPWPPDHAGQANRRIEVLEKLTRAATVLMDLLRFS